MKRNELGHVFVILLILFAFACTGKKDEHANDHSHEATEWKEMDEFHTVMAASFHPYKDSFNLDPAKLRAAEMAEAAQKWASAELPEKVDNDEVKSKLKQLENGAQAFVETVKTNDDKLISETLVTLHDLFHEIQESWYIDDQGHAHEHEHEH